MSPPSDTLPDRTAEPAAEYSREERKLLLQLAHEAVISALERRELASFAPSPHLSAPRGAFTTLYYEGRLHGCVGYPTPVLPLYRTIIETARGAAFDDPRFTPLTAEEARRLTVSISVLSSLSEISAEDVQVGRHGLLISAGGRRGLLLPQVPIEHGWDRDTFLEQTCRKAGLQTDAWKHGASIEAFTAEVFGEQSVPDKA